MRKYRSRFGEVDLDSPKTYKEYPNDLKELDKLMFREIGYALVYMDYFRKEHFPNERQKPRMVSHPYVKKKIDIANVSYSQRQRVYKLIKNFAKERKNNYGNKKWYKEQIFLFQDETENMC